MRLLLSRRAADDLDGIAVYILQNSPQAADNVRTQIAGTLRMLTEQPYAGRPIGRGLRRFAVPRLPYLVIYRVDEAATTVAVALSATVRGDRSSKSIRSSAGGHYRDMAAGMIVHHRCVASRSTAFRPDADARPSARAGPR